MTYVSSLKTNCIIYENVNCKDRDTDTIDVGLESRGFVQNKMHVVTHWTSL